MVVKRRGQVRIYALFFWDKVANTRSTLRGYRIARERRGRTQGSLSTANERVAESTQGFITAQVRRLARRTCLHKIVSKGSLLTGIPRLASRARD